MDLLRHAAERCAAEADELEADPDARAAAVGDTVSAADAVVWRRASFPLCLDPDSYMHSVVGAADRATRHRTPLDLHESPRKTWALLTLTPPSSPAVKLRTLASF